MNKKRFKRVYIEITNICNLKCEFCIDSKREKRMMTINEFETIMQKIQPYTEYIYLHIKGEPLIHPNIAKILDIADKYMINVNLTTNGVLLKENVEVLKNAKSLRQINISLHSIKQNMNFPMEKEEYLENVTKGIHTIMKENDIYVSYRIWDMKDKNYDDEIISYMSKAYNVDIKEELKNSTSVKLKNNVYINIDNVFEWPSMKCKVVSYTGNCYGIINQIGILVDGTVVPCCLDQDGDIRLGNIFENTMEEILNTEIVDNMLKGFKENRLIQPLCQRCGFRVKKRN